MLETLKNLYAAYDEAAKAARRKSTFFDNFLGTGGAANKHPCHEQFYEDVQKLMEAYAKQEPASAEAAQVCTYIIEEPKKFEGKDSYWFMFVCVGFIRQLIPFMNKEDCGMLAQKLETLYKKRDRMPVQDDTLKQLKKAAK